MENVLIAHNLSKSFRPGTPQAVKAVQDVDLAVSPGDIILIMGPSGSGKTTLLTMLGGLLQPSQGSIQIQGQNIDQMNSGALTILRRQNIGFVFQSFNLLQNLTALENVMIAGFAIKDRRANSQALLTKLGLKARLHAKPDSLSGGERQRVAIARALINNPSLILADEPTANLDSQTGHEVMQLLCEIGCQESKGVIIVSHDQRIQDIAKRIITIADGRLVDERPGGHTKICQMHKNKV